MLVFVYGTLKQGERNEPFLEDQKFISKAVTAEAAFKLYEVSGGYEYPALVERPDDGYKVYGELYDVSNKCLVALDRLEGVSVGLYKRLSINVIDASGRIHEDVTAYCFLRSTDNLDHVGQSWPKNSLDRFKFEGFSVRDHVETVNKTEWVLWDKKQSKVATPPQASLQALESFVGNRRQAFGGDDNCLWNKNWFESKEVTNQEEIKKLVLKNTARNVQSPPAKNAAELAVWATENTEFFDGSKGTLDEWSALLLKNLF